MIENINTVTIARKEYDEMKDARTRLNILAEALETQDVYLSDKIVAVILGTHRKEVKR